MKVWGVLFLMSWLAPANAHISDAAFVEEETIEAMRARSEDSAKVMKTETTLRDKADPLDPTQEEIHEPPAFYFSTNEPIPSPGGGVRFLDPKFLNSEVPLFNPQPSWWEQWWMMAKEWLWYSPSSSSQVDSLLHQRKE